MSADTITKSVLKLEAPEHVRYGEIAYRCGASVYRCLAALSGGREVTLAKFCAAVWGSERSEQLPVTVRGVIWRANNVLRGIGCPSRILLDDGKVSLG